MKRITVLLLLILTVFFSLYSIENSNVGFRRDEFNPALPDMHDIGILSSLDPVAFDQASIDMAYEAEDGSSLIQRIESKDGLHVLEHADKIGFGERHYNLVIL